MSGGVLALIGILAGVLLVTLVTLWKLHLVRVSLTAVQQQLAQSRRETRAVVAQTQALLALERGLEWQQSLPPVRGCAASPDFLRVIMDEIRSLRPRVIVECGSGVSTLVVARCLQQAMEGHAYSLEHKPKYARRTRDLLARYGVTEWATVLDAPLTSGPDRWYADVLPAAVSNIDLVIVDGPPARGGPLARAPMLARLRDRCAPRFVILLDDANRPEERAVVQQWIGLMPDLVQTRLPAEKGLVRLERLARPGPSGTREPAVVV